MANSFSNYLLPFQPTLSSAVMDANQAPMRGDRMGISGPPAIDPGNSPSGNRSILIGGNSGFGNFGGYGNPQPLQSPNANYGLNPNFSDRIFGYKVQENQNQSASQQPTNVLNVLPQLSGALGQYQNYANSMLGRAPGNFQGVNLNTNFKGAQDYQNGLHNGIDYFGKLGVSEGLQNINLQRDAANNQLASILGRTAGNDSLINVLQNQNAFRSQLAGQPLISDAQKGTAQRVSDMINLQNSTINSQNQTQLQNAGFNNQNALNQFQAQLAAGQPYQNLIDILSNLQGQGRGVVSNEIGFGSSTK